MPKSKAAPTTQQGLFRNQRGQCQGPSSEFQGGEGTQEQREVSSGHRRPGVSLHKCRHLLPAPRCTQPVPLQQTSAASPVGRLPRLQETSWALHTLHEAPPPALALPAVCSLSRRKEECGSASMEYHATCYRPDAAAPPLKSATPWKLPHHVVTDAAQSARIQRFAQTPRFPTSRIGLFSLFTKGTVLGGLHRVRRRWCRLVGNDSVTTPC
ncbi:hypothetical protein NDU88_001524 [Pleurodeles waltl]|uniref:Uncharacterized protein n=1 Tax=Pleurodeles waltl TaxID=8319 RepID=A0AAV7MLZ5_PLEWA|nr:hypothetical protein NDU88_001524 [Pleurodeles waltl]